MKEITDEIGKINDVLDDDDEFPLADEGIIEY
jgi:hypothetical protein